MPFRTLFPSDGTLITASSAGYPLTAVGETLGTLRAELLLQLGSRGDVTTPRMNSWINKAHRAVAAMLTMKELTGSLTFNLTVDQPLYTLPYEVRSIKTLSISDSAINPNAGRMLIKIDENQYRRLPDWSWAPENYFRMAKSRMLVLYPTPDEVYPINMEFYVRPEDMTDDNHSPILPTEFHEAILLKAKQIAWRALRNYREANLAGNDFLTEIRPIIDTDGEEDADQPRGLTYIKDPSDLYRIRR